MDNYLSAEQPIIDRVATMVNGLKGVYSAADLDGVAEKEQFTPAVHVLYKGDRIVDGQGRSSNGEKQVLDQLWYVVVAVRNVRAADIGKDARVEAGALVMQVLHALQGFRPTVEHDPMKRIQGIDPGYSRGFLYIPILFSTRVTI